MPAAAVAAIVVVIAIVVFVMLAMTVHRRRLQQRFGAEYDRLVAEHGGQFRAQAELGRRELRVKRLDVRPLTDAERARFATDWTTAQASFVDQPQQAVTDGGELVAAIMKERGYPAENPDRILGDLSIAHPDTVSHYRAARQVTTNAAAGDVLTEDLRQAMIHYRSVFGTLLGRPGDAQPAEPLAGEPEPSNALPSGPQAIDPETGARVVLDPQVIDGEGARQ